VATLFSLGAGVHAVSSRTAVPAARKLRFM
jgi:hypothetical protein